jgi:hypothetical protein
MIKLKRKTGPKGVVGYFCLIAYTFENDIGDTFRNTSLSDIARFSDYKRNSDKYQAALIEYKLLEVVPEGYRIPNYFQYTRPDIIIHLRTQTISKPAAPTNI